MATGAIVNAVWDLWAKREKKPMWKQLVDLTPEQLVSTIDFTYITDVLTPEEALEMLHARREAPARRRARPRCARDGYPAYTTSTGWLGYPDEKVRRLCKEAMAAGLDRLQDEGRPEPRGQRPPRRDHARGDRARAQADDGREPVLGRGRGHHPDEGAGALRSLVDRGADEPRRHPRPRRASRARWRPSGWPPARSARTA